ncbi:MAG: glycosyltransferase, partial [Chlamydiia bacterium]|nr:glycosyltransferase [Chlamydiia bacterium]
MSTVWIILPAYNEAHGIAQVILSISEHLQAIPHHFVVVDDGSVDDTPNLVEKLPVPLTLLRHPKNQGLGKALQTALHHLIPLIDCKDCVFTAESDGTQSPSLFLKLLQAIQDGADIAIAAPQ